MNGARKSRPGCWRWLRSATRRATPPIVLSSGSDKVFIQSDVTNLPALFVTNPGWHLMFDQDPAMAEKTRRKVYDMLVADKMRVQGFHYPFPANGYRREGWQRLPAGAGAVEPGDLTRSVIPGR